MDFKKRDIEYVNGFFFESRETSFQEPPQQRKRKLPQEAPLDSTNKCKRQKSKSNAALKEENTELHEELDYLQKVITDKQYIIDDLREKLKKHKKTIQRCQSKIFKLEKNSNQGSNAQSVAVQQPTSSTQKTEYDFYKIIKCMEDEIKQFETKIYTYKQPEESLSNKDKMIFYSDQYSQLHSEYTSLQQLTDKLIRERNVYKNHSKYLYSVTIPLISFCINTQKKIYSILSSYKEEYTKLSEKVKSSSLC